MIKIVEDAGDFGVADLCPWPELGDLSLSDEIAQRGSLYQRAIVLAKEDLLARQQKINLISKSPVKNHILVAEFEKFGVLNPDFIYKIKGSKNYKKLAQWLNENQDNMKKIRLDFNSCLTEEEFRHFLKLISSLVLKKIDVVEDPFPFNFTAWTELEKTAKLAVDFEKGPWMVQISKPVRQEVAPQALYLTSSMDHPVGVAHGLHHAQMFPGQIHGFLTLDVYEDTKYSKAFFQERDELKYISDGAGIGFTELLARENWVPDIQWEKSFNTFLLFNPQSGDLEIRNLFQIKNEFNKKFPQDHLLIPSSGSTQKAGDLKVLAFHKSAILNSAKRVVRHFRLDAGMNWGCVLPLFHVGGLGVLARASVTQSKVFYSSWPEFSVDWIVENDIQLLSLVPTQVFDIVNRQLPSPPNLKFVFIGGAALDSNIEAMARKLGWPLVLTYGMTETASMIAQKNAQGRFELFKGVEFSEHDGKNFVKTDSMSFAQINMIDGKISQMLFSVDAKGFELPDLIEKQIDGSFVVVGRSDEQIKISGELVNLGKLKSLLSLDFPQNVEVLAIGDPRKGHSLVLVGEQISLEKLRAIARDLNQRVKKFEKIELIATLDRFPRSALNKVKMTELKQLIEAKGSYESL